MKRSLKISRTDSRYIIVFVIAVTLVSSGMALSAPNPASNQTFAIWVLGANGRAEQYYPNNDPNLRVGEPINWTLGVQNHMGSIEYVVIRIKLLNSTQTSPDELIGNPSPVAALYEYTRVLLNNETWSVPFDWVITNIANSGKSNVIQGLLLNQIPFKGALAKTVSGLNFRFVFELWVYDGQANDFAFTWRTMSGERSAWIQVWFNATAVK